MFTKKSEKIIPAVVLALCAIFVFAACNPSNAFTPVAKPESGEVVGNGGIAVCYGEWIYYINGYESSNTSDNGYTNDIRTGSIVRIKVADLAKLIALNDVDASSGNITDAIERVVAGEYDTITVTALKDAAKDIGTEDHVVVETVVPNYYYTGNTTTTSLNGIWIFNDRIYITTPNNELDANGNTLSDQLVLASYALDGSDMQRHFVFDSNSPQLKLSENNGTVGAVYILDSQLYTFTIGSDGKTSDTYTFVVSDHEMSKIKASDVNSGSSDEDENDTVLSVSSATFTENRIFFINNDGYICQYTIGAEAPAAVVTRDTSEDHDDDQHGITYSLVSANGDYVYYQISDSDSDAASDRLYYAKVGDSATGENVVLLNAVPSGSYYGWGDKVVMTTSITEEGVTMYGIWLADNDGIDKENPLLNPAENDSSITFNKLEGDILYYTVESVAYKLDLSEEDPEPVAYAYSLSTSSSVWYAPDVLTLPESLGGATYVFTLSSDAISVVEFYSETKTNSTSTAITLTVIDDN